MVNYKLTVSYDGSFFSGFQIQKNQDNLTVQGELQRVLSMVFDSPIKISAAGRTDTGVHATCQVVSFRHERLMKQFNLRRAANGLLNGPVTISSVEYESEDFNARYSAKCRHYIYILDNNPYPCALMHTRAHWYPLPLDIDRIKAGVKIFEGRHDFRNFAKGLEDIDTTERNLLAADVFTNDHITPTTVAKTNDINANNELFSTHQPEYVRLLNNILIPQGNIIYFYFKGEAFLHSMVRLMVSTLMELGKGKISEQDIRSMLNCETERFPRIMNIPGKGLYLVGVDY